MLNFNQTEHKRPDFTTWLRKVSFIRRRERVVGKMVGGGKVVLTIVLKDLYCIHRVT